MKALTHIPAPTSARSRLANRLAEGARTPLTQCRVCGALNDLPGAVDGVCPNCLRLPVHTHYWDSVFSDWQCRQCDTLADNCEFPASAAAQAERLAELDESIPTTPVDPHPLVAALVAAGLDADLWLIPTGDYIQVDRPANDTWLTVFTIPRDDVHELPDVLPDGTTVRNVTVVQIEAKDGAETLRLYADETTVAHLVEHIAAWAC